MAEGLQSRVDAIKRHAHVHYEEGGWDFLVETYTDEEIVELLESLNCHTPSTSVDQAISMVGEILEIHNERRGGEW